MSDDDASTVAKAVAAERLTFFSAVARRVHRRTTAAGLGDDDQPAGAVEAGRGAAR